MKMSLAETFGATEIDGRLDGARVGKIVDIDKNGQVWVDYPGNLLGPTKARLTGSVGLNSLQETDLPFRSFLLVFENGDPSLPIIVDVLHTLAETTKKPSTTIALEAPEPGDAVDVTIDGKRVTFDAKEEIVLRCGKASITLTRAGKVLIRGAYLLTRSSGVNRIKGASVQIN